MSQGNEIQIEATQSVGLNSSSSISQAVQISDQTNWTKVATKVKANFTYTVASHIYMDFVQLEAHSAISLVEKIMLSQYAYIKPEETYNKRNHTPVQQ